MPHMVNGIGTWYWGKDHLHVEKGTCPSCSGFTELKSYDTTLYFVVFFLPIIPLGKKRVLFDCSSCRKHRVMPLSEWETQKKARMRELTEHLRNHPEDIEARQRVLEAFVQFQDKAGFLVRGQGNPGEHDG